jgi:hypothetical protein
LLVPADFRALRELTIVGTRRLPAHNNSPNAADRLAGLLELPGLFGKPEERPQAARVTRWNGLLFFGLKSRQSAS